MNSKILFATNRVEKYGNVSGYLEKKGGFSVIIANDGNEVLRHLDNHVPDFAILDVNLPVLDGFQLCKIMKSAVFRQCETVPVILLSETYGTYMASQLARSVGAYSILHAPFATEDLLLLIHNKLVHGRGTADNAGSLKYKAKVMIVNDDSDVVKQFEHRMGQEGYDVFVEEDAGRVIHAVEIGRPRILFLDCNMPKLNGPEILRWIKGRMPETIVIVMTDRGSEFLAIELMKAGANDYIISPFDIKSVSAICEDSFKKYDMDLTIKRLGEI